MVRIKLTHPSLKEKRTIFQNSLFDVDGETVLKPASSNTKLSNGSTKPINIGYWRGMPMFSLTLEERKTCPTTCSHWHNCYGNNMYLAKRYKHGKPLETKLNEELQELSNRYPNGFVIRLHILGDFYSVAYVKFWNKQLTKHKQLRVFGYSARIEGPIFSQLLRTKSNYPSRFVIRISSDQEVNDDVVYARTQNFKGKGSIVCPQQTGEVDSCINCGLCFLSTGSITFLDH